MESVHQLLPIAIGLVLLLIGLVGLFRSRRKAPFVFLVLFGLVLGAAPYVYNHFAKTPLTMYKKRVDGEWHVTVTGWDKTAADYALLKQEKETVVLQMANRDVTDDALANLVGMDFLKELDLSDSAITDAGLAEAARLPSLEILRLSGTKITDEGFRTHLMSRDWLRELDLSKTAVKSKTVREWISVYPEKRKALH
ncbi:MAG: hypothetical protein K2X38_17505 [Gemmataceae bacterium]|nr:hypothetical protein [Gemmataceae bacterium]